MHHLAIAITEQAFFQKFPERRFSIDTFSNGYFTGLEPQYPPMVTYLDKADLSPKVSSLQPTLQWETFKGKNVTYDLMIWRAAGLNPGNLVYSRGHLLEPIHTLEITLDADAHYFWTVRARFTVDGKTRVTEWSRRSFSPSLLANIISLGLAYLGHLADSTSGFYQFRTPP
jgi:hypothetical protein